MDRGSRVQDRLFRDRRDAGQALAGVLDDRYRGRADVVVLGLPRGGVPVAYEVAAALGLPLDVFVVRKLGVPGSPEVAMGAVASGGVAVLNDDVVRGLGITPDVIEQAVERERRELARRELAYRDGRPMPTLEGRTVILVDDGLATGASMSAAIQAVRRSKPARVVVAVPAAAESTCRELGGQVDEVVCATTPSPFVAVGQSYWDFAQTTDAEVRDLLRARSSAATDSEPCGPDDVAVIRSESVRLDDGVPPDDALFDLIGDAHFVLIGEASHGTHEFYATRAAITRRLIEEKGFRAVVVEADWPDAARVNRYVRGQDEDANAEEALRDFERFPTWMWRNGPMLEFVQWLREHNTRADREHTRAGFYGMDLYSLHRSIQEVISYLDGVDPAAAARARERYSCFDHFGDTIDGQAYGFAAAFGAGETCAEQVQAQLVDLRRHAVDYESRDGLAAEDDLFYADRNAHTVRAAAEYYRTMFGEGSSSWNLRDRHMVETLEALAGHLTRQRGEPARVVVWAHNSHVGDARPTEVAVRGEFTIGQLMRERHGDDCRLVGLTTYTGTVTAADEWGGDAERKWVRPALRDSAEEMFHGTGQESFLLSFRPSSRSAELLRSARLERAIGVIYRPDSERQSHYFRARLADQFDAVIHIDNTHAVEPIERVSRWEQGEVPETYPFNV